MLFLLGLFFANILNKSSFNFCQFTDKTVNLFLQEHAKTALTFLQ